MLKMEDLASWLPPEVINHYQKEGILELYPPQAESIERGLLDRRNMVVAIPTAAGKTLLAELAMLKAALAGGRSLYIVPLRALASEKHASFRKFRDLKIKAGVSSGDFERRDERLGKNQIIVATSEKADSLIRNGASWIRDLSVLVVDEIHLLNSANRGPTLEMTITKLMHLNPNMQVLGLSATIANAVQLADWLKADLVQSDWRPVELKEGVICKRELYYPQGKESLTTDGDDLLALVKDTLKKGAQMLIFESSRRNAEATAVKLSKTVSNILNVQDEYGNLFEKILATGESETGKKLARCVKSGAAFHHAGLLSEQRSLVEEGFRSGQIKVISCTPTLAAGLNMPARRVLIRSYKRYEGSRGMVPIPVMEYRQMAGRAGRPALDPYGESFLMAKNEAELDELMEHYIHGEPEEIWSKLAMENALRIHILSTIATGFATNHEELMNFVDSTFYAYQQESWRLEATIEKVLEFLKGGEMISENLQPTPLGSLVSKLYIDPLSAKIINDNLRSKKSISDLTLLHLVTMTPDMDSLFIKSSDDWVEEFIDQHDLELCHENNYDWLLREAKTAAMLMDWVSEAGEDQICNQYNVGPGDIKRVAETAEWLMHSTAKLSDHLDLGSSFKAAKLERRIHYGAGPDLLALLDLKGVGRVRARKLHDAGFSSIDKLKSIDVDQIAKIIGPKIAEKVVAQLKKDSENSNT